MKQAKFYSLLHGRGMTTQKLAELIGTSYARVVDAINDKPTQGKRPRMLLMLVLTTEEKEELKWVPRGTCCAEQSAGARPPKRTGAGKMPALPVC